jgi:hypothetical protein
MRPYVPNNISQTRSKMNSDASRIWSFMAAALCLHVFYAHDWVFNSTSSLVWDLLDALTTLHRVPWCAHYIWRKIHRVWSRHHEERDQRANYHSMTLPSSSPEIIRSGDFQSPCCQSCVPHTYHYLCAILVYIPIANLRERSHLLHTVSAQPTIYDLFFIVAPIDSHRSILYVILALVLFLKPQGKA